MNERLLVRTNVLLVGFVTLMPCCAQWRAKLAPQRGRHASGQSIREFCAARRLKETAFYFCIIQVNRWLRDPSG